MDTNGILAANTHVRVDKTKLEQIITLPNFIFGHVFM